MTDKDWQKLAAGLVAIDAAAERLLHPPRGCSNVLLHENCEAMTMARAVVEILPVLRAAVAAARHRQLTLPV